MEAERLFKLVTLSLTTDGLMLEEELQRVMNSNVESERKVNEIKRLLAEMVAVDSAISRFARMMTNNTNIKTQENGKEG